MLMSPSEIQGAKWPTSALTLVKLPDYFGKRGANCPEHRRQKDERRRVDPQQLCGRFR